MTRPVSCTGWAATKGAAQQHQDGTEAHLHRRERHRR
jgi:hypothetical protein